MRTITKSQKTIIHTLKSKLGMSDDVYRAMLAGFINSKGKPARSSTELSYANAEALIKALERNAEGVTDWNPEKRLHADSSSVRGGHMASADQVRMIEGMWAEYSTIGDHDKRRAALDLWIFRHWNRGGLMMVERDLVGRIKHALEAMIGQQKKSSKEA
jgi:hypothetical protein